MPVGAMYVPPKPPSPWSQLLGGIGKGVSYVGMGSLYSSLREKERKRREEDKKVNDLLALAASGKDLRRLATPKGEELLKAQGILDRPAVQKLRQMAGTEWGEAAPDLRTMQNLRQLQKEERTRQLEEERDFKINEKVLTQTKLRAEKVAYNASVPPEKAIETLKSYEEAGKKGGFKAETLSLTIPGFGTIPFTTAYGRLQDIKERGEKADTEFFRLHKETGEDRTKILDAIRRIDEGQKPSTLGALINYLADSKGLSIEEQDRMKPEDWIRIRVKDYNDAYKIKQDRLRKLAPRARQKVPEFKRLNAEAFIKGKVEKIYEPKESLKPEEVRGKIMPPPGKVGEESVQDAIADIHLNFENVKDGLAMQGKTYTKEDLINDLETNREVTIAKYNLTQREFEIIIKRIREGK